MAAEPQTFAHPHVNEAWLAKLREDVLEPDLPIIDAHHHLWDRPSGDYFLNELLADVTAGHNVVSSVYIQCGMAYRQDGPADLRPVGETEFVAGVAADAVARGKPGLCAGIVGHCDFRIGERIDTVLEAHIQAGGARFKGIRQSAGWDPKIALRTATPAPQGLLADTGFRVGLSRMRKYNLSYECSLYFTQLHELADLAQALPDLPILANHCGGPIGVGPYAENPAEVFATWRRNMQILAACPNVTLKLGGQAMPIRGYRFHEAPLPPSSGELAQAWRPFMETGIELFGANRCMFESNFPVDKGMCSYVSVWNAFKRIAAACTPDEKAALFHDTAARFYRLSLGT